MHILAQMRPDDLDSPTADLSGSDWMSGTASPSKPLVAPALTVLCHPDPRRLGERALLGALLSGGKVAVSRTQPLFRPPAGGPARPLADRYLSRQPFYLEANRAGGTDIGQAESRTRIIVDGIPLDRERRITAERLRAGVTLELSDRVALLLHHHLHSSDSDERRFGLVGDSSLVVQLREDIRRVADLEVPVLIRGETGTGKELVARAIHGASPRGSGPFVGVNMGAITSSLAAAELFGALKGSYTGSVGRQEGYFRSAHHGTLFLDEIGEAASEVQVMLLRALETAQIYPVGSQSPVDIDVRVVAATDTELEVRLESGQFKEPLLHRLSGYVIWVPSLSARLDDLGRLLVHFLRQELEKIGDLDRLDPTDDTSQPWLSAHVVGRLARSPWPGNVRQLQNVVRQLVIANRGLPSLEISQQVELLLGPDPATRPAPSPTSAPPPGRRSPADVDVEELVRALRHNRWDLTATAKELSISRPSLYNLIRQTPQIRTATDLSPEEIARCHQECGGDLEMMVDRLEVSMSALRRRVKELQLETPPGDT